jgi:hypothetical protein
MATKRAVALGKITAFSNECWRLAGLVGAEMVSVAEAVDTLRDADIGNDLSLTFGAELVSEIMADAFAAGIYEIEDAPALDELVTA